MRELGFQNFNIELIYERLSSNPKYLAQLEMNKNDDNLVLNNNAACPSAKLTLYARVRRNTLKLTNEKINDHNLLKEDKWDINLVNLNSQIGY